MPSMYVKQGHFVVLESMFWPKNSLDIIKLCDFGMISGVNKGDFVASQGKFWQKMVLIGLFWGRKTNNEDPMDGINKPESYVVVSLSYLSIEE